MSRRGRSFQGPAGTGKSYQTDAYVDANYGKQNVLALAPTNAGVADLRRRGYENASTAHRRLARSLERGDDLYFRRRDTERDVPWSRKYRAIVGEEIGLWDETVSLAVLDLADHHAVPFITNGDPDQLWPRGTPPEGPYLLRPEIRAQFEVIELTEQYRYSLDSMVGYAAVVALEAVREGQPAMPELRTLMCPIEQCDYLDAEVILSYTNATAALTAETARDARGLPPERPTPGERIRILMAAAGLLRNECVTLVSLRGRRRQVAGVDDLVWTAVVRRDTGEEVEIPLLCAGFRRYTTWEMPSWARRIPAAVRRTPHEWAREMHRDGLAVAATWGISSTIHSSQGLEFGTVAVIYDFAGRPEDNRLAYTAITRAQKDLRLRTIPGWVPPRERPRSGNPRPVGNRNPANPKPLGSGEWTTRVLGLAIERTADGVATFQRGELLRLLGCSRSLLDKALKAGIAAGLFHPSTNRQRVVLANPQENR